MTRSSAPLPPKAFTDWRYLAVPAVGALLVFFVHPAVSQMARPLLVFDAAGLGLFTGARFVLEVQDGFVSVKDFGVGGNRVHLGPAVPGSVAGDFSTSASNYAVADGQVVEAIGYILEHTAAV